MAEEFNEKEIKIIKSEADLRFFDKSVDDMEMKRLKNKSSRVASNGFVYDDGYERKNPSGVIEKKLQKEIRVAQRVLKERKNINDMFQYSDDEESPGAKSKKPTVASNAAKEILQKYGRLNDNDPNDKKADKGLRYKKSISVDNYGVPAADMIIEKYPKKKKSSKNGVNAKSNSKTSGEIGNDPNGDNKEKSKEVENSNSGNNSRAKSGKGFQQGDSSASNPNNFGDGIDNDRRPISRSDTNAKTVGHKNDDDLIVEVRPKEPEYDGFDSEEEAKFNNKNKSKVQKVSKEIFGGKYENGRRQSDGDKVSENKKATKNGGSAKPRSAQLIRKNSSQNPSSDVTSETKRSRSSGSAMKKTHQISRPNSSIALNGKVNSKSSAKRVSSAVADQNRHVDSLASGRKSDSKLDADKKDELQLPTPVANPHYSSLLGSDDDEESDKSNSDHEIVLTNYLTERKEKKEAMLKEKV